MYHKIITTKICIKYIFIFFWISITCNAYAQKSVKGIAGENFSPNEYTEVTFYEDGSLMTDSMVDGIIYKKINNKYYKKNFSGAIKSSWFGTVGNGINDDTQALQKAISYCVQNGVNLEIDGRCLITKPLIIDRLVDAPQFSDYFVIFSNSGGELITNKDIPLFTSSIEFRGAPVSQLVNFKNITFRAFDYSDNEAYVLDGSKFLRTQFNQCSFVGIKLLNAERYIQSIYLFHCNIRYWNGEFIRSMERTYDLKMIGCLAEHGETCLHINEPFGCSILGSTIEGMRGSAIIFNRAEGFYISGNYFEGNYNADIDNTTESGVSNGIAIVGNFFCNINKEGNIYSILWGETKGAVSYGNSSYSSLHKFSEKSNVITHDVAKDNLSNFSNKNNYMMFSLTDVSTANIPLLNQQNNSIKNGSFVNFTIRITIPENKYNEYVSLEGLPFLSDSIMVEDLSGYTVFSSKGTPLYISNLENTNKIIFYNHKYKRLKYKDLSGCMIKIQGCYSLKSKKNDGILNQ